MGELGPNSLGILAAIDCGKCETEESVFKFAHTGASAVKGKDEKVNGDTTPATRLAFLVESHHLHSCHERQSSGGGAAPQHTHFHIPRAARALRRFRARYDLPGRKARDPAG